MLPLHPSLSHWDSGLIFSQCSYCTQPGPQVYCERPGLILPPSVRRAVGRRQLAGLPGSQQAQWVTLTFSVKESLFKALFPLTGRPFYFQDAELMDEHHIRLLTTLSDRWREGEILSFDWRRIDDRLLSWILIRA